MRPRLPIAALVAVLLAGCSAPARAPEGAAAPGACPIDAVAWLVGAWRSVDGDETTVERWTREGEDRLVGESATTRGGARVFGERLAIACSNGVIAYTASPEGQATAVFRAVEVGPGHAVFENPEHDFPTRIEYRLQGDALVAEVSGETGGGRRVETWRFAPEPGR